MDSKAQPKKVLVHLGPHKTGSTFIQNSLSAWTDFLQSAGISYVQNSETHRAALDLANERFEEAEHRLSGISETLSNASTDWVILSQEDFCGALIGRTAQRRIYPKLTKNLRILMRALRPHRVKFAFFVRDEAKWLRSSYHQHLKFRTRFCRYSEFAEYYGQDFSWSEKLEKPREVFGANFITLAYDGQPASGVEALLGLVDVDKGNMPPIQSGAPVNPSPTPEQILKLERVNEMSEFKQSAWFSKSLILGNWTAKRDAVKPDPPEWPPKVGDSSPVGLPSLFQRVRTRVQKQDTEDVLPPLSVDLERLAAERLPAEVEMPKLDRWDIRNQSRILDYHLRGKSKLSHLNALVISYLRRDTPHTEKARALFHRIWREQGVLLVNELSTRWLISTLQTFLDHGENEAQRMIGTAGYFYGNMLKIYEGERALEGMAQDACYANVTPQTKNQFRGLDRYNVGGSDLMLNTNALALEIAQRDEVAGLVLQEFLLRVKSAESVFSRHDRTRKNENIDVKGFEDVWTFFEPWSG
jgi:hypothetical protein